MAHCAARATRRGTAAVSTASTAAQAATPPAEEGVRRIPHTPMRRRIAAHMVESLLQTAPHVTTVFEADMTAVLAHRARHR